MKTMNLYKVRTNGGTTGYMAASNLEQVETTFGTIGSVEMMGPIHVSEAEDKGKTAVVAPSKASAAQPVIEHAVAPAHDAKAATAPRGK